MSRRKDPADCIIQPKHKWTKAEHAFIVENIPGRSCKAMAEMIEKQFGWKCRHWHVRDYITKHGIAPGFNWGRRRKTPIGTLRLWTDHGRKTWYEKVGRDVDGADEDGWKKKHIVEWEKVNGKIPEGHVLMFADGDSTNWHVENLTLVTFRQRSERAMLWRYKKIRSYDQESSLALNALLDLNKTLNERKGKRNDGTRADGTEPDDH